MTGRTVIWKSVLRFAADRRWLGYGFDVFWSHVRWAAGDLPSAHNGYLDLLLAMGVVGLLIFVGGFLTVGSRACWLFREDEVRGAKWPLFILLFFAV